MEQNNVFEIPCHLIMSSYDSFEDKKEILDIIKEAEAQHPALKEEIGWIPKTYMTVAFLIQYIYHPRDPFQKFEKYGDEARNFMEVYLEFMAQTHFDDLPHWTDEQLQYIDQVGFAIGREDVRKILFNHLKKRFSQHHVFQNKYSQLFKGGFK